MSLGYNLLVYSLEKFYVKSKQHKLSCFANIVIYSCYYSAWRDVCRQSWIQIYKSMNFTVLTMKFYEVFA